jgi:LysR family glycine cleavage system transcriptional activator
MRIPRRFLPSTTLLTAFESASRLASFTAAARELDLTQSAVSRQIRLLEDQLGVALFVREHQTVRLTIAGESYARDIRDALRRIGAASMNLRANPQGGTLNLAVLPTFGARWLTPRLPGFLAAHAGVAVNILSRPTRFDFRDDTMDAAIDCNADEWIGTKRMPLLEETTLPVASPAFAAQCLGWSAEAIRRMPLLHLTSRPDAWERWFRVHDVPAEGVTGMLFDQFSTMAQAASVGLGIALMPIVLIERELSAGALVPVIDEPMAGPAFYSLTWPLERDAYAPLVAFRRWLADEMARYAGQPG